MNNNNALSSEKTQDSNLKDFIELILLAATWGTSYLFLRIATPEFGPIPVVALRTVAATLFLAPFVYFSNQHTILLEKWRPLLITSIIGTVLPFILLAYSSLYATAGYIAILNSTVPIFTALIAYVWLKERLHVTGIAGILIGFSGVVFLVGDNISLDKSAGLLPVYAVLIASFFYGLGALYTKQELKGVSPLAVATGSQLYAGLLIFPLAVYFWPEQQPGEKAWFSVIVLGVLCTGIALVQYFRLIVRVGPTKTVMVAYLLPVFSMLWGAVFLAEEITVNMLLGCSLTLVGVGFTTGLLRILRRGR